jgi:hypothetical protein
MYARANPFRCRYRRMYDTTGRLARARVIRLTVPTAFVAMTAALLAVVALATVTPGQWSGSSPDRARAHARVTFDVSPSAGFIQPALRIDLRGCRTTRTLHLRPILQPLAVTRGRFATRARFSPPARAMKVRLRFHGRFISEDTARGVLRGRLRYAGGHRCRIPRLPFVAHPAGLAPDDPAFDDDAAEALGDVIIDDDEFDEDDELDDEDGEFEEDDDGGEDEGDDGP